MKIHLDNPGNLNVIESYGEGFVSIRNTHYRETLCVMPTRVEKLPHINKPEDFNYDALEFLLEWSPEVILLGTGNALALPNMRLVQAFHAHNIGCDVMDSAAACRTYNVLVSEGRSVATVLLVE